MRIAVTALFVVVFLGLTVGPVGGIATGAAVQRSSSSTTPKHNDVDGASFGTVSVQDDGNDLNYVTWDRSSWGAPSEHGTDTGEVRNQPFSFLWHADHLTAGGTNYYVSPSGNDSADGLSPGTAWESIDNGDQAAILAPGDTVNILPGLYLVDSTIALTSSGAGQSAIVYTGQEDNRPVIRAIGGIAAVVRLAGSNLTLSHVDVSSDPVTYVNGIQVDGDSCRVYGCVVQGLHHDGIEVNGSDNLLLRTVIYSCGRSGIQNGAAAERNGYHGNTIWSNSSDGIEIVTPASTNRIFNNIISENSNQGISGPSGNVCGYNDVWANPGGDYAAGIADSAGGISADPRFVDPGSGDFSLQVVSPAIDAGLDLGYSYKGTAPDMGAVESDYGGAVAYIGVIPATATVVEGSSLQFAAHGYTSDSIFVSDVTDLVTWSTTDPSGSVTSGGFYTAGHDPSPPEYHVPAVCGALSDSGTVTVVSDGTLHHIVVELGNGTPFPDTTLTTDNDTTQFYCRGYDSGGDLVGDIAVAWSMTDGDSIGDVDVGPATTATLRLSGVGACRVVGTLGAGLSDTTGLITSIHGLPASVVIAPDTATTHAGTSIAFTTSTFDADGNDSDPIAIDTWEVLGGIGTISGIGLFTATTVGTGSITCAGEGLTDTTGAIAVIAGELAGIEVTPDSIAVTVGSITAFEASGVDAYGNSADVGSLVWEVIGGIGEIDGSGKFTAHAVGSGRIAVTSSIGGVADTNRVVVVLAGDLSIIVVSPDTATVKITGTLQFTAWGFDQTYQPVDVGDITWGLLGGIGTIDSTGAFVATNAGVGYVSAISDLGGIGDTTDMIVVGIPTVSDVPLGTRFVHAGQASSPILAFKISNAFDGPAEITGLTLRDASRGSGSPEQVRSNIDSVSLFLDSNESGTLDPSDTLIAGTAALASEIDLSFVPVTISPGSKRTFFVGVDITQFPCDLDSLDMFLLPSSDIETGSGSPVAGPDTLNSLGYTVIDGLLADQVRLVPTGTAIVSRGDNVVNVLSVDIPRNGYSSDALEIFSVFNAGTADTFDIDSLLLYLDDGDNTWNGGVSDLYLGSLSFTGDQWELSGLSVPLTLQVKRFYLAASISDAAANGATLEFGIPLHGLEMSSGNDGPIDGIVDPVETITIATSEMILVSSVQIDGHEVTPGGSTGPILCIEFVNGCGESVAIDSVRFDHITVDPDGASQTELDSQIDSVSLWLNRDGIYETHGSADSLIASAQLCGGEVAFATDGLTVRSGGVMGLFVECLTNSVACKNGNLLNLALSEVGDIHLNRAVTLWGDFPLKNEDPFTVTTFPASNVTVHPVASQTVFGGETDCVVLDFELPKNGYADDRLRSLRIVNTGSTDGQDALLAVELWAAAAARTLSGGNILLGRFERDDDGWEISNLAFPLVCAGNRLVVTVDVAQGEFAGGTLSFEIPIRGALYESGTDGPDDAAVGNPHDHLLFPASRITVIPIPADAATVRPGAIRVPVLTFALYNGYAGQAKVLEAVRLSNRSGSISTDAFADYELGQVSIYCDQNANRILDDDLLMASGYFTDGTLRLNGLHASLHPESLSYFFVTADLPLDVIDGDTLAVGVDNHSDFTFGQAVNINGDLPLLRGGHLTVDGSVAAQYSTVELSGGTVSPGDVLVPLFAFHPAYNGDQVDVLESLAMGNDGDADTSDITSLRLWLDLDGDDTWQMTDSLLEDGVYSDGSWVFSEIGLPVEAGVPALFITGDVTPWATPNTSFHPVIPLNGCRYTSANDGPVDVCLTSDQAFVVSTSGLRLAYEPLTPRYSVGQHVEIRVHVTNILSTPMYDVSCEITGLGEPGAVSLDSSFVSRGMLAPGGTAEFKAWYTAVQAGAVRWRVQAFSANPPEASPPVETETVLIQSLPSDVGLEMISSIPTAVTRGQRQVFPMSIKYRHSDLSPWSASIRLDSLRLSVEDGMGTPIAASSVFSKMVLATGYTNLAILEAVPSESSVLLTFSQPTVLKPGEDRILSLRVDIDSTATASSFALAVASASMILFTDENTGMPVPIDPTVVFPLKTPSCRIRNPSQRIALCYTPSLKAYTNYGQQNVSLVQLLVRHPGGSGDSQVQLTNLSFEFVDEGLNAFVADDLFDRIRLLRRKSVVGELASTDVDSARLRMWLSAPPVLSPGEIDTMRLEVSVSADAPYSVFGMTIPDSTFFVLRDLSSGAMVTATSDTGHPVPGPVFPIFSGLTRLKHPAVSPEVCITSKMPASVIAGSDSVDLVEVTFDYPVTAERSPVRLESVSLSVLDTLGRAIDPYDLFDRIGFRPQAAAAAYQSAIAVEGGCTVFHLGPDGIIIQPGTGAAVCLIADIEADTRADHFIVAIYGDYGIALVDGTDPTNHPGLAQAPGCQGLFPFITDMTEILTPAGTPTVSVDRTPVQIGFPGQRAVTLVTADLAYTGPDHQGDLALRHWNGRFLRRTPTGLVPVSGDRVFEAIHLLSDHQPVATDTTFAGDTLSLRPDAEYVLSSGSVKVIRLTCDIRPDAQLGNYIIEFPDASFIEFVDRELSTVIHPELTGEGYPFATADLSVSAGNLANSLSNWPNPFNPASEHTTIGYVLAEDARVDIEIFTITGELVRRIADSALRTAGSHDQDTWDGFNDSRQIVFPGTYLCRITATYPSGRTEDVKRKVAVIR